MDVFDFAVTTAKLLKLNFIIDDKKVYVFDPKQKGIPKYWRWEPKTDATCLEAVCEKYKIGVDRDDGNTFWEAFTDVYSAQGDTRISAEINCILEIINSEEKKDDE